MKDKICCFDGSVKSYDNEKRAKIREIILNLIQNDGIRKFCFMRKSPIEGVAMPMLKELRQIYPDIELGLVFPNIGKELELLKETIFTDYDFFLSDTISRQTPEGWEIKSWGRYMVDCSSHMICCIDSKTGKSADTLSYAKGRGDIKIFNILGK